MVSDNWRPLTAAFGEGTPCPAREAAVVVAAVLADLTRFHRSGAVHGAVDPQHVLVGGGGRARLADAGQDVAALAYQAPEVHAGKPATARSDLFGAGLVLYRLLTGMNPFEGSANLVKQRVTNMMAPRPSEIQGGVPAAFDAVVEKALAKRPEDRYEGAEAFAEALMQALVPGAAAGGRPAGGDETLATTIVRRPSDSDATMMRAPAPDPDATIMRRPAPDPDATMMRAPAPDPDATIMRASAASGDQTRRPGPAPAVPPPPPAAPAGGKGMMIGAAAVLLLVLGAAAVFLLK